MNERRGIAMLLSQGRYEEQKMISPHLILEGARPGRHTMTSMAFGSYRGAFKKAAVAGLAALSLGAMVVATTESAQARGFGGGRFFHGGGFRGGFGGFRGGGFRGGYGRFAGFRGGYGGFGRGGFGYGGYRGFGYRRFGYGFPLAVGLGLGYGAAYGGYGYGYPYGGYANGYGDGGYDNAGYDGAEYGQGYQGAGYGPGYGAYRRGVYNCGYNELRTHLERKACRR